MSDLSTLTKEYNSVVNDITSLKADLNVISDKAERLRIAAAEMQFYLEEITGINTSLSKIRIDSSLWEGRTKKDNENILEESLKTAMKTYQVKVSDIFESYTNEINRLYQQQDSISSSLNVKSATKSYLKQEIKKEKVTSDE
ncbi:DUF5082 family protein [Listeria welshimeri]|uniref:DUF5082 domain-containing protein n=2 Tax=Listeria welshimeri TaxID=1643 RepID=A0A7X0T425_LISWE|nr:DUF5082 family protein [Listeria welshimeri]MBC1322189.1 DUF5082 domain-containing protein [Listeria welshimeri]MBC1619999.1 DUF5082 domain-containing protein [Listeria welshimeri]MBC1939553.1 DUF5082 domain-containing protein [Listeria welshimeri]MBF2484723.1 DUF5082 family protein [Listeria welshimeri]CAK19471.1 hypothetical protein lwe0053 [Listeria welshimeri serovar 6b str. SLCC5334]